MLFNIGLVILLYFTSCVCGNLNKTSLFDDTVSKILHGKIDFCDGVAGRLHPCLQEYVQELCNGTAWALQMFDATGKLKPGLQYGNLVDLGYFQECLDIDDINAQVKGQYCIGTVSMTLANNTIPYTLGICIPHTCSTSDLSEFSNYSIPITIQDVYCQTVDNQPKITTGDIIAIILFSFLAFCLSVSSLYEIYLYYTKQEPKWDSLLAFSIVRNGKKLFTVVSKPNQLKCIAGIRSISMMWVILGHSYSVLGFRANDNGVDLIDWNGKTSSLYVIGSTVSVDSFFLMGGVVMTYVFMASMKKDTYFNVPMYYFHRYLRLTPALAAVILVHVTLLKHIGYGPYWPMSTLFLYKYCKESWWSTLLYIQNFHNPREQCIGQSWYLAVDMQLFILSPLILIPLRKYVKATLAAMGVLSCISVGVGFFVAWHYDLPSVISFMIKNEQGSLDYISTYYAVPQTRASPWLIGLFVGYYIHQFKYVRKPFTINKHLNLLLWGVSLAVLGTCVFAGSGLVTATQYERWPQVSYTTFVRPAWSLALAWVIFACVTGYGGPINVFLSLTIFQVIARLSYGMYLVHYTILCIITLSQKGGSRFSDLSQIYNFWGNFVATLIVGTIWTLTFESPIMELEKLIFGGKPKKKIEKPSTATS